MTEDKSLTGRLVGGGAIVAEVAITLLMLHVTLQVVLRVAFNLSLENTPEIVAYYYMSGLIFMVFGFVTLYDSHIAASLFSERMSASTQRLLITVIMGVLGLASLLLAWEMGWEALKMTAIGEIHIGSSANLPKWPARWFLPIGFGLMALAAFMRARRIVLGEINPEVNSDSAEQGSDD